jgi:hypothetical protein
VLVAPPLTEVGDRAILTRVGGVIVTGAVTDWLPSVALIFAVVEVETDDVETVNVPDVCPATIVTVAGFGTIADPLSLAIGIVSPPAGAGLLMVTVAVLATPPVTVAGERAMLTSAGGVIVSGADTDWLLKVAVMLATVDAETGDVEIVNVPVVWPEAMVTAAGFGTVAEPLSLARAMVSPPEGAGLLMVTVAVLVAPPVTEDGARATLTNVGGVIESGADFVTPL